jgi:hypothetical protein
MIIRVKRAYSKPKKSNAVDAILHEGELVLPVKETSMLNRFLFSNSKVIPDALRKRLRDLITTVPQFK